MQLPVPAVYMLNHDEARGLLIEAGWTPSMHHWAYYEDRPYLQSTVFYEKGYSELADCSGTGYGFCTLLFHDAYSNTLVVTTQGDQAKVVDSRVVPDE